MDTDALGEDRVERLLPVSLRENNGEDRENVVKTETKDNGNTNLTVTGTVNRLGMVFFCSCSRSVFLLLLTGMMIFSQVRCIIDAMFRPVPPAAQGVQMRAVEPTEDKVVYSVS